MSAIAGVIHWDGAPAAPAARRAVAALALHGRDGEAVWNGGEAALGYRKTILFAEDRADRQPLIGGGGRFTMVADLRLDNREDLASLLGFDAERARALPDSSYLMAAFEAWGTRCVDRLLGSFAFAVWDRRDRTLFLARDHVGSRPLHYWRSERSCVFASMPSALFTHPDVPRALDEDAFARQLCRLPLGPDATFYRDIVRVPVSHTVTIGPGTLVVDRYWAIENLPPLVLKSDEDYVAAFRDLFDEAVRCRLRGLHPIGSHLSSGRDSSTVTATAARLLAERGQRLTAFTAVPPEGWAPVPVFRQIADEGPLAAKVAARYPNIDHVLVRGSACWDFGALDRYARYYEQPRPDASNAGWWESLHLDARKRGIRVMLMGGMGNLSISYDGNPLLARLLRQGRLLALAHHWPGLRAGGMRRRALLRQMVAPLLPPLLLEAVSRLVRRPSAATLLFGAVRREAMPRRGLDPLARLREIHRSLSLGEDRDAIWRRLWMMDLSRVTCGTMAAADVDMRDPTSDKRVMAFCRAIPEEQFLHRGHRRWLLRRAMEGALPPELLAEPGRGRQAANWCDMAARAAPEIIEEIERLGRNDLLSALIDTDHLRAQAGDWPVARIVTDKRLESQRMMLLYATVLGRFARRLQGSNE